MLFVNKHATNRLLVLHVDLLLGDGDADQVVVREDAVVSPVELVEDSEVAVHVSERRSLDQLSLRVRVDGAAGRQLAVSRHLEHAGELHRQLALLSALRDTEHAGNHHAAVELHGGGSALHLAVLADHEVAPALRAQVEVVAREAVVSPRTVDDVGGRDDHDVQRGRDSAQHHHQSMHRLVLVEHRERHGTQHADVHLAPARDRTAVLNGALTAEEDLVVFAVEVQHGRLDGAGSLLRIHDHHITGTHVVHVEEVLGDRPGQTHPLAHRDLAVVADGAQTRLHDGPVVLLLVLSAGGGDDEMLGVHSSDAVELVAVVRHRLRADVQLGILALARPATGAHVQLVTSLVHHGEGCVGQRVHVGPLVVGVGHRHVLSEGERHLHVVTSALRLHRHREQVLRTHHDEVLLVVVHGNHVVHLTVLAVHGGKRLRHHLIRVALERHLERGHASVVHGHQHEVRELQHLHVLHRLGHGLRSDVAVDGGSGSGEGMAMTVDGNGGAGSEGDELVKVGELIAVDLLLNHVLEVTSSHHTYAAAQTHAHATHDERAEQQDD